MSRLQQRRRRRLEARRKALKDFCQACWVAAIILLFYFVWQLPVTIAYFTDREETQAAFRATSFAENLTISPGKSKTNDSPGNPGPAFKVAKSVNEQIYLNFGTYPSGNNRNFPHVLTVKNIGDRILTLNWYFSESLAQHFETQNEEVILEPGDKIELGFKLDASSDAPGEYFGSLHLSALNGFIIRELPARLRLAETGKDDKDDKDDDGKEKDKDKDKDDDDDDKKNGKDIKQQNICQQTASEAIYKPQGVTESVYQCMSVDNVINGDSKNVNDFWEPEKAAGQTKNKETKAGKQRGEN
ncbi:MAG: hypothetical protein KGZ45_02170 [Clostridium sp.]|nr:hypothetical protein [Clostridium sp.]